MKTIHHIQLHLLVFLLIGHLVSSCDRSVRADPEPSQPVVSCEELPADFTPLADMLDTAVIEAEQLYQEEMPLRQSVLTLSFAHTVSLCNELGLAFRAAVHDPITGQTGVQEIPIDSLRADGPRLQLWVGGPVSPGSLLSADEGAFGVNGSYAAQTEASLDGTGLLTDNEAALWGKAYEPTNPNLFPPTVYGGVPSVGIPQSTDPAVVWQELSNHFQTFVEAGKLSYDAILDLLQTFEDQDARQIFTDPQTGQFEPQLMAAVLGTAGTPGAGSIPAIIDGKNDTGRPAQVVYGDLPDSRLGEAEVIQDANGQDQWVITLNERMRNEPFQVGAPTIAHEAMHQDNIQGQHEELIAKSVEVNTWKQLILVKPELATLGTGASKAMNLQLLMHENSGSTFPNGGLFEAPLAQGTQDVLPNSDISPTSFEDHVRNNLYPDVPAVDTPGNRYLDKYLAAVGYPVSGSGFGLQAIGRLDNPQFFTPEENFRILEILELRPVMIE